MRRLFVSIIVLLVAAPAASAKGNLPTLIFPVVGGSTYYEDDFGDPRPQGSHEGNDLLAPRNTPVVAAEDGVVRTHVSGRGGLMLYLRSKTREYLYIHLSNDKGRRGRRPRRARDGVRARHQGRRAGQGRAAHRLARRLRRRRGRRDAPALRGAPARAARAVDPYRRLRAASIVAFASPSPGAAAANGGVNNRTATTIAMTMVGRISWVAATPDGTGRLALRLERMGLVGTDGFETRQMVVLTAPAETLAAAAALGVGTRVRVATAPAPPTLARQALRPGAWQAATVEAAPAARR